MGDLSGNAASKDQASSAWPMWQNWFAAFSNPLSSLAPQALNQQVLPGWMIGNSINVTEQNSSAPDTEREILATESYGRQLGRMMDALAALIAERPQSAPHAKAIDDFLTLRDKIDEIKLKSAARRIERIQTDLTALKNADPNEYARLVDGLRKILLDAGA